ncbi:hypothetical protein CALVIDRAFT_532663 [Calocera viscosa TUFC12733]|uniref:Uncharacterized protein n=1 Tax=Calocera viscosa (strain TUFC12733) TaxID=1330018 RepID=A0A167RLP7_CALVF|nr:hypothetical protein CALVIDRAFT_532663 [Calocera viscosa TUFC12733]
MFAFGFIAISLLPVLAYAGTLGKRDFLEVETFGQPSEPASPHLAETRSSVS